MIERLLSFNQDRLRICLILIFSSAFYRNFRQKRRECRLLYPRKRQLATCILFRTSRILERDRSGNASYCSHLMRTVDPISYMEIGSPFRNIVMLPKNIVMFSLTSKLVHAKGLLYITAPGGR